MFSHNRLIPLVVGVAVLLLATNVAEAQRRAPRVVYQPTYRPAYSNPQYRNYYPGYVYPNVRYAPRYVGPTYSYYYTSPIYRVPSITVATATADIRVILSDPQAMVYFNGHATTSKGTDRLYHTPPMTYGETHTYHIRATWIQAGRQVTQERIVSVLPGQTTVVDFTRAFAERIPLPASDD